MPTAPAPQGGFRSQPAAFGAQSLTSAGNWDTFAFSSPTASPFAVDWAVRWGGTSAEAGDAAAVDKDGNYLIGGYFSSSPLSVGSFSLTSYGDADALAIKLNPTNGAVLWAYNCG
jgi:hypothetical protein